MRDINELIGIIKGVNFDGIVNEKEVIRLQSWVDKNKNLAYESKQAELIKMVESVLEDNIIEESEKKAMLSYARKYLEEVGDGSGKMYELNGIIEGIVCDGEVNNAEVTRLKAWMDSYGESLRSYKPSVKLCKSIDEILEDGVVTEEEQKNLLEMLSEAIRNSQFETKLDYLCRQVKGRKNIGVDLIDILDNEMAMQEIHKRAEEQLIHALSSYSGFILNPEIIVVSLVLIAMLEYDGNYYGSVRNTYVNVYRRYSEQKVEGLIRSVLGRYKKQNDSGSRSRIINVALENAIVPQSFLTAFFEFVFDIYKLNFEYDLPEEIYEEFQFVYEGLRNSMISGGDDISVNVTQKTYKLIAATKQLISNGEGLDAVIKLSILIAKLIDKRYWGQKTIIFNPYLKTGFEGWEVQLKEEVKRSRIKQETKTELRSKWEPKFVFNNNMIYLVPPVHKVKAQYDYRDISILVLNNGKEIYRNNSCDIREIIGGYQVLSGKIKLNEPLGTVTYRLIAGDETIYDSKKLLYRNYIIFDTEGAELRNNTDYEGTAYFCYEKGNCDLDVLLKKEHFVVGYKLVRIGDVLSIGKDVVNFSSMIKPGVFGQIHNNCFVRTKDNEEICVFKKLDVVVFEADSRISKFEIRINGRSYKLSDFKYKITTRENILKYVVELDDRIPGVYEIEVYQIADGRKIKLLRELCVFDPKLEYKAERINDAAFHVSVVSDLLKTDVDMEIVATQFDAELIWFEHDQNKYFYLLPFDFGFHKLNDNDWCTCSTELWIEDISLDTVLSIYDSECDGLLVYTENGSLAEDEICLLDKKYYKQAAIGFLNSYKNGNKYVLLVFTVKGKKKWIIPCYNKCVLEEGKTEIVFKDDPKQILITPVYHGKNHVFFEMFDANGTKVYGSKLLNSGQTWIVDQFVSFEKYKIEFHEKMKMLMLRKNTLLYSCEKIFYAKEDFVGRTFKIDEVFFNQRIRGVFLEKSYHFTKAYVRLNEMIEKDVFLGEIFVKTLKGEWLLSGINPVCVEICSEVIDDTLDVYITNAQYGDGLLMDFEKHGILNSLDHPTAPDIFLYTISTKEEV